MLLGKCGASLSDTTIDVFHCLFESPGISFLEKALSLAVSTTTTSPCQSLLIGVQWQEYEH